MVGWPAVKVFVSYRRQDSNHIAGRLFDRLVERFGPDQVFMDVDSIAPGFDFHDAITQAVGTADVVLALIGPRWAGASDDAGRRRLDDPDDLVRAEIWAAIEQGVRLVPVLVDGARMPAPDEVPPALQPLLRRQAVRLDHPTFRSDVEHLVSAISSAPSSTPVGASGGPATAVMPPGAGASRGPGSFPGLAPPVPAGPAVAPPGRRRRRALAVALAAVVVLAAALIAWQSRPDQVAVPDLTGMTVVEAGWALGDVDLVPGVPTTTAVDDPALVGRVVGQDPVAVAQVAARSTVSLTVGGPLDTPVPLPATQTTPVTTTPTRTTTRTSGPKPSSRSTAPSPTSTASPTETTDELVAVPEVTGLSVDDARASLAAAGFESVVRQEVAAPDDDGRVLDQSPPGGTRTELGATVLLVAGDGLVVR